jgi:opacity protein-like surface antigen
MKSFLLSALFVVSLFSFACAQDKDKSYGYGTGIKVGTNINKIAGESFKNQFTYGYSAGAFVDIKLSKEWSLQPEVLFNQVSADTSDKFRDLYTLSFDKISKIKLNYLTIPLILNYHVSKGIALQAGPQLGILINQNKDLLQNGKEAFKSGDFSLLGGLQIKFSSIRLYGRYAIGLNNLNDIDNKDKWKNQSIQLGIGLTLL